MRSPCDTVPAVESLSSFHCPECGAEVHPNASGCRECGARKENGEWLQPEVYDGVDLPDDDFDYEAFLEEEFGERTGRPASAKQAFWWLVAVITLIAFLWLSLRGW